MKFQQTLLQLLILLVLFFIEKLAHRVFKRYWSERAPHVWWLWTVILWLFISHNFASLYWCAYPVAIWMAWAIILVILQATHNHEFIYRRYWPVFWRLSAWYALIVFIVSQFAVHLPVI